ncbi:esterase/lipase family protein [Streptomyces iconiensis]|uniref:Alpha/beta fold hydrolase n=1 Tax=Streptomyces iconiensis TaxID=1384038 RepID=A0ABT7A7B1_9ACTN|nr:alpha/beta fold hydrolase [Streptomyces iconiensis]MDJ1136962.1 alpha/beta fold hydrolase [Streptomyces iconiensis]
MPARPVRPARGKRTALLASALAALLTGCGAASERERDPDASADTRTGTSADTRTGKRADPVVLVHGLGGSPADWDTFRGWFARDGYAQEHTVAVDVSAGRRNAANARAVAEAVTRLKEETGAGKVDLVAFSMGNLSARHYLTHLGGTAHVREFAGIAGPNRGMDTPLTEGCGPAAATDACEMARDAPFLRALNSGDPTPGPVRYATWRSEADEIVPAASTPLEGAANHRVPGALGHVELIGDESVYRAVHAFLNERG